MSGHEKFNFRTLEDIQEKVNQLGVNIKFSENLELMHKPVWINGHKAENSIAVLPMEGCDSNQDGSPSELVKRRYLRFSEGGAGLVWWEANAVVQEGRANPNQMMITEKNLESFRKLIEECNQSAIARNGYKPLHILQLTHSGRYARPVGHAPAPRVPQRDPILDPISGVTSDAAVVSDTYLESLVPKYAKAALLAKEAGFDGVDIKACHRYLLSELLASHTREGKYGGSFENRSRLIVEIVRAVRQAVGEDYIIASRFNVFDAHPYPYGFGCDREDLWKFDPTEPMELVKLLCKEGVNLLSNSAGNPYYIYPQVTRPFDLSSRGIPVPDEHPLTSVARLFEFTRQIQKAAGDVPVIGNGYTWLRQFAPFAGAANLLDGSCRMMGLGRSSIAYPDGPRDILLNGKLRPEQCCITCSKCTQIMRDHGHTGCVVRDSQWYLPLYREAAQEAAIRENRN
ncbi:MAG: NADH:flavin oxidoreductase [Lachnospiraceae bacterium]|nr:NADH:flavin oxidoreductase [Lachnospiraceae bacterium]